MGDVAEQSVWIMCCGEVGRHVARLYQQDGVRAIGWVRTGHALRAGQAQGTSLRRGKFDASCYIPFYTHENAKVFWFAPPPARGEQDIRLRRFLSATGGSLQRLVLLVRVGCGQANARGKRYADAEAAAREWAQQHRRELVILRLADCYNPCSADRLATVCKYAMDEADHGSCHEVACV